MNNIAQANVVAAFFAVESEAYQAFSEVKLYPFLPHSTLSQLVLLKKQGGQVIPLESFDSGEDTNDDTIAGGFMGALIGILGGPLGILLGGGVGALIGMAVDNKDIVDEMSILERVSTRMQEGDTALLALVQEDDESALNQRLEKFQAVILRWDAADIQEELEEAKMVEKELERQAKQEMRKQKSEERQAKKKAYREKFRQDFENLKKKHEK